MHFEHFQREERLLLIEVLEQETDWLVDAVLSYAKEFDYTKYTSTLREAWILSVQGLVRSLREALILPGSERELEIPVEGPLLHDSLCAFGVAEGRRHRQRGVGLPLFLSLFKYYRRSFGDLLARTSHSPAWKARAGSFLNKAFDIIEVSLAQEWERLGTQAQLAELQSANRAMTNEKNKFLTVFESLSLPAIIFDATLHPIHFNHAAVALALPGAAPGRHYYGEAEVTEFYVWLLPIISSFMGDGLPAARVERTQAMMGEERELSVFLTRMLDTSEKFSGVVVTLQDESARNRAMREREELHRKLMHSAKLASLGTLVAGVAHEINNPLAILRAHAESLLAQLSKDEPDFTGALRKLEQQQRAVDRIVNIVSGLRSYARMDPDVKSVVSLHGSLADTLTLFEGILARKGIGLEERLASRRPWFLAPAGRMSQVIMNLISNAADAIMERGGDGGSIHISTHDDGDFVVLTVSDDGCGMDEAQLARVFDPFFTTKPVGSGTGLGMSISQALIAEMGGHIAIASRKGEGTQVSVRVPSCNEAVCSTSSVGTEGHQERVPLSILLVHDELEVRGAIGDLVHASGHHVELCSSAEEAMERLRRHGFDLVLSDLRAPRQGGTGFIRMLAREFPDLPVAVIMGGLLMDYSQEDRELLRRHARQILRKPVCRKALEDLLRGLRS